VGGGRGPGLHGGAARRWAADRIAAVGRPSWPQGKQPPGGGARQRTAALRYDPILCPPACRRPCRPRHPRQAGQRPRRLLCVRRASAGRHRGLGGSRATGPAGGEGRRPLGRAVARRGHRAGCAARSARSLRAQARGAKSQAYAARRRGRAAAAGTDPTARRGSVSWVGVVGARRASRHRLASGRVGRGTRRALEPVAPTRPGHIER